VPGATPSESVRLTKSMTTSFTRLHHLLTWWGFTRPVGLKMRKFRLLRGLVAGILVEILTRRRSCGGWAQ
jgi:hypothetical protein